MQHHITPPNNAPHMPATVFAGLSATGLAPLRRLELGDGMSLALWRRETDGLEIAYAQPGHHTLSYYLSAGSGTRRLSECGAWRDGAARSAPGMAAYRHGTPATLQHGDICSLPDDHVSRWLVRGELTFLHLYFDPRQIERRAVMELDCEPRAAQLHDRRYGGAQQLQWLCRALAAEPGQDADGLLRASTLAHEALSALLRAQGGTVSQTPLRGGLPPHVRRRLRDYIEANLDQPLTLGMLAALSCLSEFHFLRLFRTSFGMPPHTWIAMRRIERARRLLRSTGFAMQRVADDCGYGDLAHFSRRFRQAVGCTPTRYRAILRT
ncbi:AraC family transcriptional regulator [Pseudoduganella ginsengisoli]|nr:AraC family transcriptional regulator [Pseudoduganella ginsengisoli]